jgi:hypothetical protein
MTSSYISFAHITSESGDNYYLALPGYFSIGDESDCSTAIALAAELTGEDESLLYVQCLDGVPLGLNNAWLM